MGAFAIPSNKPFIARKPLKTKRKRTAYQAELENLLALLKDAEMEIDKETNDIRYVRNGEVVAVFKDDENEE
ncbi:MAG: hypothetical protein IJJ69_00500 [Oscillospiraceae bacterium]|nr:hypothetical protein [Oscillospiraceae bacterium]